MTQISDQPHKPRLPKKDAGKILRERQLQRRSENFRNVILRQPLIECYRTTPLNIDEPEAIGVQWYSGIASPSRLYGYPDQSLFVFAPSRIVKGAQSPKDTRRKNEI